MLTDEHGTIEISAEPGKVIIALTMAKVGEDATVYTRRWITLDVNTAIATAADLEAAIRAANGKAFPSTPYVTPEQTPTVPGAKPLMQWPFERCDWLSPCRVCGASSGRCPYSPPIRRELRDAE